MPAGADKDVMTWAQQNIAQRRDGDALGRILMFLRAHVRFGAIWQKGMKSALRGPRVLNSAHFKA